MLRTLMELWKARRALARADRNRKAFEEGVAHERRRVLHLLEHMQPDRDPATIDLGATLFWAEGWNAAHEQAVALAAQRPMPQSFYDGPPDGPGWPGYQGPPESIDHVFTRRLADDAAIPNIGLVSIEHADEDAGGRVDK